MIFDVFSNLGVALSRNSHSSFQSIASKSAVSRVNVANATANSPSHVTCPLCSASHLLHLCPTFISKNPNQRREIVNQTSRYFNCLSSKHVASACQSRFSCRVCHKRHHSMLHLDSDSSSKSDKIASSNCSTAQTSDVKPSVTSLLSSTIQRCRTSVLLATAWLTVRVTSGRTAVVPALLDQGSEMTFISENLSQLLRAKRIHMPISVHAVGCVNAGTFRHAACISITPRASLTPSLSTTALILNSLTSYASRRN